MSLPLAVAGALGAAASSAVASALLHRSAVDAARAPGTGSRPLVAFARATVVQKLYLAAVAMQGVGFLLHAFALHAGELSLVQPMLICVVLFALPLNRWLLHERVTARELYWAGALVVGLSGFLLLSTPSAHPRVSTQVDPAAAITATVLGAAAVIGCLMIVGRRRSARAASLLAGAAGIAYAGQGALLKACTGVLDSGALNLLWSWQLYALIVVGTLAVVLNQLSFRAGPLAASLPVSTTVNPILGVVLGATVYHEDLRNSLTAIIGELGCLALLAVAALALTRLTVSATTHEAETVYPPNGELAATVRPPAPTR
ncbi:MAG TPA: DMT family transporter [Pseudonocardiaceae bacterium]